MHTPSRTAFLVAALRQSSTGEFAFALRQQTAADRAAAALLALLVIDRARASAKEALR